MRYLIALGAIAASVLNCSAGFAQVQVCENASPCKTFSSQEEADRYVEDSAKEKEAQARDIVLHMPINYRDCILPALLDEMVSLAQKGTEHIYVADMDKELQAKLAEHGVFTSPESAFPEDVKELQNYTHNTSYWHFSFRFTAVLKPNEEYEARIGYHCGSLCLGRTRYVLRRVGATCSVTSKEWEGGA
jgi:hypothetical protein